VHQDAAECVAIDPQGIARDVNTAARDVDAEIAKQRLIECDAEAAAIVGIDCSAAAGDRSTRIVETDRVRAAGWNRLLHTKVSDGRFASAGSELRNGRRLAALPLDVPCREPVVDAVRAAQPL